MLKKDQILDQLKEVKLVSQDVIQAVHDDDLIVFLKSLGVYDKVINHEAKCFSCKQDVTLDNLQCVFPFDGQVCFCCSDDKCYGIVVERGKISV
jgi:hypothetical protein